MYVYALIPKTQALRRFGSAYFFEKNFYDFCKTLYITAREFNIPEKCSIFAKQPYLSVTEPSFHDTNRISAKDTRICKRMCCSRTHI